MERLSLGKILCINKGNIIAIDYGLKRIGIACANIISKNAVPLKAIQNNNYLYSLRSIVISWDPIVFVIGLPNINSSNNMHNLCLKFGHHIYDELGIAIRFISEEYSSIEAEQIIDFKINKKNKACVDSMAAAIILQDFINTYKV